MFKLDFLFPWFCRCDHIICQNMHNYVHARTQTCPLSTFEDFRLNRSVPVWSVGLERPIDDMDAIADSKKKKERTALALGWNWWKHTPPFHCIISFFRLMVLVLGQATRRLDDETALTFVRPRLPWKRPPSNRCILNMFKQQPINFQTHNPK